jgi:hypothetical protein
MDEGNEALEGKDGRDVGMQLMQGVQPLLEPEPRVHQRVARSCTALA